MKTRFVIIVLLTMLLAACSSIPLGTLWKLSRMQPDDLLSADPQDFRIAVRSEEIFLEHSPNLKPDLQFMLRAGEESLLDERFDFVDTTANEYWLLDPPAPGLAWRIYALVPAELDRFRSMQNRLEQIKASGSENGPEKWFEENFMFEGGGGIDDDGNLVEGAKALPEGTMQRWAENGLSVDVLVRLDREADFMVLLRNLRIPVELKDPASDS